MAGVRTKTLIDLRNRCQAALDSGESIKGNPDFARARKILDMPPNSKGRQSVVRELDAAIAYRGVTPVTIAPKRVAAKPQPMNHPVVNRLRECVNNGDQLVVLTRSEVRSLFGK